MPMHKIEVDDEVYSYLESKIKSFADNPNTVLHGLLFGNNSSLSADATLLIPQLPLGTPKALEQILQVVHLIRAKGYSRSEATRAVAGHYGIATETVIDKYTRQLGLTAIEFDGLLAESNESELREYLSDKFEGYESLIKQYLS